MLQEDETERFKLLRDIAEHNAMFQNSEGVKQVREARENAIHVSDDEFEGQIEETFGRPINLSKKDNEEMLSEIKKPLDIYQDFDEVEFVPFGG